MTTETFFRFEHPQNITVGLARVIFDTGWSGVPSWKLPGGHQTTDRHVAHAYAVIMNRLMGGVSVTN